MKTIKIFSVCLSVGLSSLAYAENYAGDLSVGRVHLDNEICYLGITGSIDGVCSSYDRHLKFSVSSNQGKLMYSLIVGAKLAGKKIDIWYTPSSTPGTNESTGCGPSTMAVLTQVSLE